MNTLSKTNGRLDRVVIIAKRRACLKHKPHRMYQTAQNDTFRTKRIKVHEMHDLHDLHRSAIIAEF